MAVDAITSYKVDVAWAAQTVLPMELKDGIHHLEARAYQGAAAEQQALVLINRGKGPEAGAVPLVRVHSGCVTGDVFHSLRCDCYLQLQAALERIVHTPNGVLIYLPYQEGRGIGLVDKIRAYAMQDRGADTVEANIQVGAPVDGREYGLAAHILKELDFNQVRLLTNNPVKIEALQNLGIEVIEREELVTPVNRYNRRYIETKRIRMAHEL